MTTTTTTTTTPTTLAILLDLHSSPSPSPTPITAATNLNHTLDHNHSPTPSPQLHTDPKLKKKLSAILKDNSDNDVIYIYLMTSSGSDVTKETVEEDLLSGRDEGQGQGWLRVSMMSSDNRLGSFYRAKVALDNADVTEVRVLCRGQEEVSWWSAVCGQLFTPVHHWRVISSSSSSAVQRHPVKNSDDSSGSGGRSDGEVIGGEELTPTQDDRGNDVNDDDGRPSHTNSSQPFKDTAKVQEEIRSHLKTQPSLLGLPEVMSSPILPGRVSGFVHGFSTRRGGISQASGTTCSMNLMYTDKKRDSPLVIGENVRRLSMVGGFDPETFHIVRVEHGNTVWVVGDEPPPPKYDAIITNRHDVTIAAAGADCLPLIFADPVARAVGVAHAGWQGSVKRVAEAVIRAMGQRFGSRPQDVLVALGPGLGLGCFQVLREEASLFAQIHPGCVASTSDVSSTSQHYVIPDDVISVRTGEEEEEDRGSRALRVEEVAAEKLRPKTPVPPKSALKEWSFVDLQRTNVEVLLQAGVTSEHIDVSTSHCTKCNPHLFFSFERDGFPFGNQVGFICMPSAAYAADSE